MRFVEAELDQVRTTMPNLWSLVKDAEEFWGDLPRHGRQLLKIFLDRTLELWRDQWVEAAWHQPAPERKTSRNGYCRRRRWATTLGPLAAYSAWRRHWQARHPEPALCVERALPELLAVFDLPAEHQRTVLTTNPIERTFREVRRRTRSIGTFVDDASTERIVYGLAAYFNRKCATHVCPTFRKTRQAA